MNTSHQNLDYFVSTRIVDSILVTRVSGSWTLEMHQAAAAHNEQFSKQLNQRGDWASLVIIEDTLVSCLEVLEAGRAAIPNNPHCSRLRALAWVINPSVEGYTLLLPKYRCMFEGILLSDVFDEAEAGLAWLNQILSNHESIKATDP